MKKLIALLLSAVMVLSLSLAAFGAGEDWSKVDLSNVAKDKKVTLVYAEVNPLDTIVGQIASDFKRIVEEMSGGSITIDVKASGVLGSENDVLDAILGEDDSIDISRISAFALNSYGAKKSMLLSIPYTFVSRDHWWAFANSELAQEFLNEPKTLANPLPIRGIFYGEEGFRHFFANRAINSLEDLKGMKIRVSNDPIMNGMVEGLGASPTVVSFGELYSALNTGVCDAAEQPIANYRSNAFPEVAPYMILDGHTLGAVQAIISDSGWNKLSEAQKAVIMLAGQQVQKLNQTVSQAKEDEVLAQLKKEGATVVDVTDKAPWQAACSKVISDNTADQAELYQKILDLAK